MFKIFISVTTNILFASKELTSVYLGNAYVKQTNIIINDLQKLFFNMCY